MSSSPATISTFVNSVVRFLDTYGFDGLDLDWEYPNAGDKVGYANVIKALRAALGTKYQLTLAVTASPGVVDAGYDVPVIADKVDAIHLMTYDYYGSWNSIADHHAPLYKRPSETEITSNVDYTVNHWISRGASPSKLVLGIPTYGKSWRLADPSKTAPPTRGTSGGAAGPVTQEPGTLAYFELCLKIQGGGWTVVQDSNKLIGPYAYSYYEWVGYDDPAMAAFKTKYALNKGLGGVTVWDNSFDDFNNACGEGVNPIQSAMLQALSGVTTTTSTSTSAMTSTTTKANTTSATPSTTKSTTTQSTTPSRGGGAMGADAPMKMLPWGSSIQTAPMKVCENYEAVVATANELINDTSGMRPETRSRLRGYSKYLLKFETVFSVVFCTKLFTPCELFATALQNPSTNVPDTQRSSKLLHQTLQNFRDTFDDVYEKATSFAKKMNLEFSEPKGARAARPPKRYEQTPVSTPSAVMDGKKTLRKAFSQAIDLLLAEIERRFDQPSMNRFISMERILLDQHFQDHSTTTDLENALGNHAEDFNLRKLSAQIIMLRSLSETPFDSVKSVAECLLKESSGVRAMLSEVVKLYCLDANLSFEGSRF